MQSELLAARSEKVARRNHQGRRGRWLPYLGGAIVAGLIIAGLWPEAAPVEIARANTGTIQVSISEEGKTRIKQRYLIAAPVAGQLRRIPFKAGAELERGKTILAVIDPLTPAMLDARARSTAQARRDAAMAEVDRARAAHTYASNERRRMEKLGADSTISVQELEAAQFRETAAAKELVAAENFLREAEAELAEFTRTLQSVETGPPVELTSPVDGRVLRVFEESARAVSAGTPLLEIGDPSDLEVVIEVLSRDGAIIEPGTKVELEQWGGGEPLEARVRLVEPAAFTKISALGVEEQRVNVIADITTPFEPRRNLGDNFRVEGRIITTEIANVLKVPSGAVFRRGSESAVFVVRNGRAERRRIRPGVSSGAEIQVLEGLSEGEEVIVYPGDRVREGQRVRPIVVSPSSG